MSMHSTYAEIQIPVRISIAVLVLEKRIYLLASKAVSCDINPVRHCRIEEGEREWNNRKMCRYSDEKNARRGEDQSRMLGIFRSLGSLSVWASRAWQPATYLTCTGEWSGGSAELANQSRTRRRHNPFFLFQISIKLGLSLRTNTNFSTQDTQGLILRYFKEDLSFACFTWKTKDTKC